MNQRATASKLGKAVFPANESLSRRIGIHSVLSKFSNQIADMNAERSGNFLQRLQGDLFFGSFDFTNVIGGEVGLFGKLFLAQMRPAPHGMNVFPDDLIDFRARHFTRKTGMGALIQRLSVVNYRLSECISCLPSWKS